MSDLAGAGDTYLAAFALSYVSQRQAIKEPGAESVIVRGAMGYANRAARIAVSKRGVVAVKADEVV